MRSRVWSLALAIAAGCCAVDCPSVNAAVDATAGVATTTARLDPASTDTAAYYTALKQAVAAKVIYPQAALVAGEQGVCRVKATFLRSGEVVESMLVQSAGYADLDQECVAVFGRISRLPAAPAALSPASPRLRLEIPVTFSLAAGG